MLELTVPDMSCGHCVATITRTIKAIDQDATVSTDLATHKVAVQSAASEKAITEALEEAGYPATAK